MIYTRWGGECTVVAELGKHTPDYLGYEATLILVAHSKMRDYSSARFYWATFLKGEPREIDQAVNSAPKLMLSGFMLNCAIKEAE